MAFPFRIRGPDHFRDRMVETQLRARGIQNREILEAFRTVPRHLFMPGTSIRDAYADRAFPIGHDQTISQPFVVALMLERLDPGKKDKVLEIGAGSGYVTALLARLVARVIGIERIPELAETARKRLERLSCENAEIRCQDGTAGLPEEAPFDGILVSASADDVPETLVDQLSKDHGRLIVPLGPHHRQRLVHIEYRDGREVRTMGEGCVFVRLVPEDG